MAKLKCPKCSNIVEVERDQPPSCDNCGFSGSKVKPPTQGVDSARGALEQVKALKKRREEESAAEDETAEDATMPPGADDGTGEADAPDGDGGTDGPDGGPDGDDPTGGADGPDGNGSGSDGTAPTNSKEPNADDAADAKKSKRTRRIVISAVAILLLAAVGAGAWYGWNSGYAHQYLGLLDEPDLRAERAAEQLEADLDDPSGGELASWSGHFEGEPTGNITLDWIELDTAVKWGRGETASMHVAVESEFISTSITMICSPKGMFLIEDDKSYRGRPPVDTSECVNAFDPSSDTGQGALDGFGDEQLTLLRTEERGRGILIAHFEAQSGTQYTFHIDHRDQATRVEIKDGADGLEGWLEMEYGKRSKIPLPSGDDGRIPASVTWQEGFSGGYDFSTSEDAPGVFTLTIIEAREEPPWEEMEVRVVESAFDPDSPVLADFDPVEEDGRLKSGFRLHMDDEDGKVTPGDAVSVESDDWDAEWSFDLVLWDTWADRAVNDLPVPAPPALWLLAGLAALVLLRRRGE